MRLCAGFRPVAIAKDSAGHLPDVRPADPGQPAPTPSPNPTPIAPLRRSQVVGYGLTLGEEIEYPARVVGEGAARHGWECTGSRRL